MLEIGSIMEKLNIVAALLKIEFIPFTTWPHYDAIKSRVYSHKKSFHIRNTCIVYHRNIYIFAPYYAALAKDCRKGYLDELAHDAAKKSHPIRFLIAKENLANPNVAIKHGRLKKNVYEGTPSQLAVINKLEDKYIAEDAYLCT